MKQAPKKPNGKSLAFTKENSLKTPKSLLKKAGWGDDKSFDLEIAMEIVPRRFPNAWERADNAGKRRMLRRYRNWMQGSHNRMIMQGLEGD
tara:strand:+ start:3959 stop:4231 length:273 start_codon:yes stop_codon:yes gene_type:complete